MIAPETVALVESGCALILGTVGATGEPYASRAWGLTVLARDDLRIRLLLDLADDVTVDHLSASGAIAITATSVPTLRSVQLKGRAVAIEAATHEDRARASQYCDAFLTDVEVTERTPRALLERIRPGGFRACIVEVCEVYDQTPGPRAGEPMTAPS